ncbi:MAG: tRNA pseudouridine(13) synthase TruD [Deltaproteobacteria bacterium]|nr:tRNA pseudouridine(13) synthase TruD [Deltaproteobacteria bacterium]
MLQPRLPPVPPQARLTREQPADFRVEEIPAYPASGSGDHVMVTVEKTGLSTLEVARRLAQHLGVDGREVGFAGRKDVHAVAVQRFTVPRRKHVRLQPGPLSAGITILEVALHKNKLQLGHLHGNRFDILLRVPVVGALERLRERAPQVTRGVVNYFGPQRFGVDGNNVEDGIRVLTGARRGGDPRGLQLLVSAVQSHVFNLVADFRVRRDPDVLPVTGDILVKVPSGAPFHCDAPETDAARVMEGAVAVTGPLPGSRMRLPRDVPLTWESRILADVLPDPTVLTAGRRAPLGDRRAILVRPQGIQVDAVPEGIRVRLSLPPGSFATSVLREWAGILEDGAAGSAASESAG